VSDEFAIHVYRRTLDPNGQDSLAKLARQIDPGAQVLDLGAGPGVLGCYLTEKLGCTVDGVECNPAAVTEAAPWYRHLECADLERIPLAEVFTGRQYDVIVCADILEHLRRPGDLLAQVVGMLAPEGRLLASVPNVAYAGLIAELLAGELRYRPEGLLDETHLHFFTLKSFRRLLEEHGLQVVAVDSVLCDLRDSEFTDRYFDALPPALIRTLLGRPEALVYQFIVTAMVAGQTGDRAALPALADSPPELRFACQLFWRWPGVDYQGRESSTAWGRLGVAHQTLALSIPVCPAPLAGLRLDLADRPGLLRLYAITLHDYAGRVLWAWDGQRNSLASQPGQQAVFAEPALLGEGVTVLLTGDDPVLDLSIPASALTEVQNGGELRLELSWPMSLDYISLVQDCIPRRDALTAQTVFERRVAELEEGRVALEAQIAELVQAHNFLMAGKTLSEAEAATLSLRKAALEAETAALTVRNTALEQQLEILQTQLSEQAAQLNTQAAQLNTQAVQLNSQAVQLNTQAAQLSEQANQLIALRSSHSWRLTALLRSCSSWLRRWFG
jgi:2-polyprenyl-3-methyl-5-hydroxy-6-metoxy-1,4-benzoquinol methylase